MDCVLHRIIIKVIYIYRKEYCEDKGIQRHVRLGVSMCRNESMGMKAVFKNVKEVE